MRWRWGPAVLGSVAGVVYAAGAARTPLWADSSKLAIYALAGYLPSLNPGDHAGWTAIAVLWLRAVPWPGPVASLGLLSAASGGIAVGLLAALLERSGRPPWGAVVLAAAHPLWWAASVTETYALAVALVMAVAWAGGRQGVRAAVGAGVVAGVAVAVHAMTAALVLPLLAGRRGRELPAVGLGVAAGSAPVWLAAAGSPPDPLTGHHAATAASWSWVLRTFLDPGRMVVGALAVAGLLALALGPVGAAAVTRAARSRRRPVHPAPRLGWLALAGLAAVLAGYSPYRLHLMVGLLVTGALLLLPPRLGLRAAAAHVALQAVLYAVLAPGAHLAGLGDLGVRRLPHRDNARYFLWPWKAHDRGALRYAHALLEAAPPDAVVLADFNPGAVLELVRRLEGIRSDLELVPTAVDEALGDADPAAALARRIREAAPRPVVLADRWPPYYRPEELEGRFGYRLTACGPGWLVSGPENGGPGPSARTVSPGGTVPGRGQ